MQWIIFLWCVLDFKIGLYLSFKTLYVIHHDQKTLHYCVHSFVVGLPVTANYSSFTRSTSPLIIVN